MVQQMVVAELLDDGGRVLVRVLIGLALVVVLALLLVATTPGAVVASSRGLAIDQPTGAKAGAPAGVVPTPTAVSGASRAVEIARQYLGVPYVFGGSNPATGLDCSGLVQLVFHQLAIQLPRTAQPQFEATTRLAAEQLQPGDLVFFSRTYVDPRDWITHVGIYIGAGMQINAPTEGQVVSIQPVFSGFWGAHFAGGGRVRAP